jgi:hypothetical protein
VVDLLVAVVAAPHSIMLVPGADWPFDAARDEEPCLLLLCFPLPASAMVGEVL